MGRYIFLVWWLPLVLLLGFGLWYVWHSVERRMTQRNDRSRYGDPRNDRRGTI